MARVERILFAVAIVALGWYASAQTSSRLYQASQFRELEELRLAHAGEAVDSTDEPEARAEAAVGERTTRAPERAAAPTTRASEPVRAPERRARDTRGLVGRIDIPRIGVSAIIREGVDDRTLRRAVGHVPGTALPGGAGNIAIAGHRDTFFSPLKRIRAGDRIDIRTPDGDFSYIVSDTRIVAPTDVSVLGPTPQTTLTLITCYPFNYLGTAPDRFIVRAEKVDSVPAADR